MRAAWSLLVLLLLPGCVDEEAGADLPEETAAPTASPTKAPAEYLDRGDHSTPERVDGNIIAEEMDGRWRARQTVEWVNGYGDATAGRIDVSTTGGSVAVGGFDAGVYVVRSTAWAEAGTEEEARVRLASITFTFNDTLGNGVVALQHGWTAPDRSDRGVSTIVAVPQGLPHNVQAASDGIVLVQGLRGLAVGVAAGTFVLDGAFDRVEATVGGPAKLNLSRAGSGPGWYTVVASGAVQAVLGPGTYDLTAEGRSVRVDLAGTEPVGEQTDGHAHVRSPGYSAAPAPTSVSLRGDTVRVQG